MLKICMLGGSKNINLYLNKTKNKKNKKTKKK